MQENKCQLRLIGDVHGERESYLYLLDGCEYSLQIGDLDLTGYDWLSNVNPERHKFFGGNHDNYYVIDQSPNNLGDFGVWDVPSFGPIFWVRGGFSIDLMYRIEHKNWWREEELSIVRYNEALELYKEVKPKILVSHECPLNIVQHITNPEFMSQMGYDNPIIKTKTNQVLQAMTDFHQPKLHVFGHYHRSFDKLINGVTGKIIDEEGCSQEERTLFTRYICVGILQTLDFPANYIDAL